MIEKPRCLGLDIGDRRIGIALSDRLGWSAKPLEALTRKNIATDVSRIAEIARKHEAERIVIGLPLNMDGSTGGQAAKVQSFGNKLAEATELPIVYEDERLSTSTAIDILTAQGVKTGHNRELVDMQAAAVILQSYLDRGGPQ